MNTYLIDITVFIALITMTYYSIVIVHPGMEYTIERLGIYKYSLEPGTHFILPFIYRVGQKVSVMEQSLKVPLQELKTSDNKKIKIEGSISFQIIDVKKATSPLPNLSRSLTAMATRNIKTILKSKTLEEITTKRGKIDSTLIKVSNEDAIEWGANIIAIELGDLKEII
ncbi:MAG: SPFH/Band 7/PHB domain protein [Alphaproteobacteria bacterium]|nr:SPFH/Band 7/PHB domain protein [Alphaproteobacteria bacterium]